MSTKVLNTVRWSVCFAVWCVAIFTVLHAQLERYAQTEAHNRSTTINDPAMVRAAVQLLKVMK